ncbi:13342_t:CDS:1, partial [Dentiscutata erythropus]
MKISTLVLLVIIPLVLYNFVVSISHSFDLCSSLSSPRENVMMFHNVDDVSSLWKSQQLIFKSKNENGLNKITTFNNWIEPLPSMLVMLDEIN